MEPVTILQLVVIAFALFAFSRAYLRFKERKLSSFAFVFWMSVWFAGMITIFFPDLTTSLARLVGIGRGVDVILYASIIIIFYLIFRVYIKIEETQKQITELARKIALNTPPQKNKK